MGYSYPAIVQGNDGDQFGDQVTALFPVGQKMELPDNRIFRYAEAGVLTVANNLYQSEVPKADWLREATATATVKDDTRIDGVITTAALVANDMVEGYVMFETGDDFGRIYQIAENEVGSDIVHGLMLKPDVTVGVIVTASNSINMIKNPWKGIIAKPASDQTALVVGVTPSVIASGDWGWCQTRGVGSCLLDGVVIIGQEVRPSETVAGAVSELNYDEGTVEDNGPVGRVVEVAPTADFGLILLTIE
ncbi:hypothetical protein LCGC14_1594900 [marine sediment metagenome]|uniref:Uncharacterized protein n=1 Tax=marine sediment metagenome TaxID=412755 RepID=A0A0F9ID94_9ZZZZ